jgi:hypothetical protein
VPRKVIYDADLPFTNKRKQSAPETATTKRGKGRPAAKVEQHRAASAPKTELELLRERNILDRKNFIGMSGLMKAKEDFDEVSSRAGRPKGAGKDKKQSQPALREKSTRKASQMSTALKERSQDLANCKDLSKNLDFNECLTSAFTADDVKMFIDVAKIVSEGKDLNMNLVKLCIVTVE